MLSTFPDKDTAQANWLNVQQIKQHNQTWKCLKLQQPMKLNKLFVSKFSGIEAEHFIVK